MTNKMKIYTQAPLPFMGQKRRWSSAFKTALVSYSDCHTFIDLFGGSGLLSHFAKAARPDATVIYNDFDGYTHRLAEIPRTNELLKELRAMLKGCPDNKRIEEPYRSQVLQAVERREREGYVDYVTLSASVLFSGKYVTSLAQLRKETLYNTVRTSDYCADGYLDGITVTHEDYRALFDRWKSEDGVCFLIDPPYLSTQASTYTGYWRLRDYLDVLRLLHDTNYFYFTSEKSSIIELCEWMGEGHVVGNPFAGAVKVEQGAHLNHTARYTDIMLHKHKTKGGGQAA